MSTQVFLFDAVMLADALMAYAAARNPSAVPALPPAAELLGYASRGASSDAADAQALILDFLNSPQAAALRMPKVRP